MMTCRDVIDLLVEYLDATLDATAHEDLERHLEGCGPCVAYLNTYRRTRSLVGSVYATEMPDEMKRRLRNFLLKRLGDTG